MLKTVVIVDYQNILHTGTKVFSDASENLVDLINPLNFANALIEKRNSSISNPRHLAVLSRVEVYRGLPSQVFDPVEFNENMQRKFFWEKDARVKVVHRNLKYEFGIHSKNDSNNKNYSSKKEKGIDVLCALSVVRNVQSKDVDLVILASHDSDLGPALEEAFSLNLGHKVETASWFNPGNQKFRSQIKTDVKVWNTRLTKTEYRLSLDSVRLELL